MAWWPFMPLSCLLHPNAHGVPAYTSNQSLSFLTCFLCSSQTILVLGAHSGHPSPNTSYFNGFLLLKPFLSHQPNIIAPLRAPPATACSSLCVLPSGPCLAKFHG
jgi:hypothetical protein